MKKLLRKNKQGLTLVEAGIVLGIALFAGFVSFSQFLKSQETLKASMAGAQIRQIGDSVNAYISNHYDTLSSLTNATGTASDLGPRTCVAANNTCTITVSTLVNEGLLPVTYSGRNVYGAGYNIVLKRSGTSPYYKINGVVTTAAPLMTGSNVRYDLLGHAMQSAGIDSGMTRSSSSTVSGYNGSWSAASTDYNNINAAGLLAYQAGYGTYNYSVFLRRDGTLPMTGNLNMGANSINNAVNITASGTTTSATLKSTGTTNVGTNLTVGTTGAFGGRVGTRGYDPNDVPASWGGGLRTQDVLGSGTLAVLKSGATGASGNFAAYLNNNGNIYAANNVTSANTINATNRITGGEIFANTESYANNWFRAMGNGGIYFQKYGGGLYMADTSTITAYGGKNIRTSAGLYGSYLESSGNILVRGNAQVNGNINASGQIISNGRLTTNELLQINRVVAVNASCSPNGLIGRTSTGQVVSCTSGKWQASGGGRSGYFCRLTSFDEHRSEDYVGYTPRTDKNCPVISPGQRPQGYCSCIKVMLDY